jgi:hypothetical protein
MTLQDSITLFYHENHVIKCSRCSAYLLKIWTKRLYSDGNIKNTYQCLICGHKFVCCARHKDNTLSKRINILRCKLVLMEKQLLEQSY